MEKIEEEDKTEYYNTPAWSLLFPKEDEKSMEEKKTIGRSFHESPEGDINSHFVTRC